MDNFVCEEESDEDEDLQDLGCEYSASFTTPGKAGVMTTFNTSYTEAENRAGFPTQHF